MTGPSRMPSPSEHWDVREARIRLPRRVAQELKRTAEASGRTMNELIAGYIDSGLTADARPGVFEIAPWFSDYLRRKGGPNSRAARLRQPEEDIA